MKLARKPVAGGILSLCLIAAVARVTPAAPVTYEIDPEHTYPSFEADHLGLSIWRGKFNRSRGEVRLDKAAQSGTVGITVDLASVDFGHDGLNAWARGPEFFDVSEHPRATYAGRIDAFVDGAPSRVVGALTLHGVTRPLVLRVESFRCMPHPLLQRELCGADALGTFRRDDFGLGAGKDYGMDMDVTLRIQVEAIEEE